MTGTGLFDLVRPSFDACADRPCLEVGEETHTYAAVAREAAAVAASVNRDAGSMVGILAARSRAAYTGILGVLASGRGYVPLHPGWPIGRLVGMIERAGASAIVVGNEAVPLLPKLLAAVSHPLELLVPDFVVPAEDRDRWAPHVVRGRSELVRGTELPAASPARGEDLAYIIFTSGTTGRPKGVPVLHRNIRSHLSALAKAAPLVESDRCSQYFDLTFDPSVHDIFLTWMAGACLCVIPDHARIAPAGFIRDRGLTCWYSVPSAIVLMQRLRMLEPGSFPGLRLSRFGGEALLDESARAWHEAAPNSAIENMYGPTECTLTSVRHVWSPGGAARIGIVPIGTPVGSLAAALLSESGERVDGPGVGELCLAGEQVTNGYLDDDALTRERYIELDGAQGEPWYRTGDVVERGDDGVYHYLGRVDEQVQVQGNRVELSEVDEALRVAASATQALAAPWPADSPRVEALYGFVPVHCDRTNAEIRAAMLELVPKYMVPERIFRIEEFPLTANGKHDRRALAAAAAGMMRR